uniref:Uncharacterized protein n=1 Tax=Panagrolaimus sp. ES5 TaxID=591445 RepID=A0AC34FJL6_9BILA
MLGGKKKEEKTFPISATSKTLINFDENFSFSVAPKPDESNFLFVIGEIKGDYELVTISTGRQVIRLEKDQKTFTLVSQKTETLNVSFSVLKNFEYKKVFYYNLVVAENQLRCLDLCEYFENEIILAENLKFKYFIKRNAESKFEVHISNPNKIEIRKKSESEGTTEDFHDEIGYSGANFHFSFVLPDSQYMIL